MTGPATTFALVVFDVAGTTVLDGDLVASCLHDALAADVAVPQADVLRVMGLPKPVAIHQLLSERTALTGAALAAAVDAAHHAFRGALLHAYSQDGVLAPADGASAVFARLRAAGVRVALDTGFDRAILDAVLIRLGWDDGGAIDVSVASDEVARGRPHPDLVRRAMALASVDRPERVVKVGDTPSDLEEGLAAGCGLVVGVTHGTHTREQLTRPGVEVVDRLADILPLMGLGRA